MEQEKDTLKKDTVSGTENTQNVAMNSSSESIFLSCREKSLKIASALHLVTELFSETEPIREALRVESVSLITIGATQRVFNESAQNGALHDVLDTIVSLVTVLHTSKLLSDMNATILLREIHSLAQTVRHMNQRQQQITGALLEELFTDDHVVLPLAAAETPTALHMSETVNKGQSFAHNNVFNKSHTTAAIKTQKTLNETKVAHKKDIVKNPLVHTKKARSENILNAINVNGSSIKDIAKLVRGCSEKTIQRELNSLIASGHIVREGEKRWSVYKRA